MSTESPIRVLLAIDEQQTRRVLAALLSLEEGIQVIAEIGHGDDVVDAVRRYRPDVAVIDAEPPGSDGLTAAVLIGGRCAIVVLTSFGRPGYLRRAMAAGVGGFLGKDASADELAAAIRKVAAGGRYLDTELAAASMTTADSPLSEHERDALRLAGGGATITKIAVELHVSETMARGLVSSAMTKLNAEGHHEAVHTARRQGWL
ncbi:response regulator transcription factor [Nonomuraea sp. NPDC049695]|uniref:response regulator transcription factor n=1 Tax=Nonomuraea sp. NPDC049695 TaxID=3154734 RepID=UPI00343885F9